MILQQRIINKQDILSITNDITIYNTYLDEQLVIGAKMNSPFRKDNNPSFGFFQGTSEVCWKDLSTGESGDCFDFVKRLFPNFTYFDALSKIASDLNLPTNKEFFYRDMSHIKTQIKELSNDERAILIAKANTNLQVKFRDWVEEDANFWQSRGVNYQTLQFYRVHPISHIFINSNIITADKYAYAFIENKDNTITYKIYQPFNNKGLKWLNSHDNSIWQGWEQLPQRNDQLFITKSLKDVMALGNIMRIPAVSMQSENILPKPHIIEELEQRFDEIYILYDNDYDKEVNVGQLMGKRVKELFKNRFSYQVEIPTKYQAKDFSDLVLKYGYLKAKEILTENLLPF